MHPRRSSGGGRQPPWPTLFSVEDRLFPNQLGFAITQCVGLTHRAINKQYQALALDNQVLRVYKADMMNKGAEATEWLKGRPSFGMRLIRDGALDAVRLLQVHWSSTAGSRRQYL